MPHNETHKKDQTQYLGQGPWDALNKWMDEPRKTLGMRHRAVRHADTDPASMVEALIRFGPQAPAGMIIHTMRDRMHTQLKKMISRATGVNVFE